jgi:hypothetical protein
VIVPTAVYTLATARHALGLRANSLPREVRQRRLRVSKRCGIYYTMGAWLLSWLEGGEVRQKEMREQE